MVVEGWNAIFLGNFRISLQACIGLLYSDPGVYTEMAHQNPDVRGMFILIPLITRIYFSLDTQVVDPK